MTIQDTRQYESTYIVQPGLEEADYKAIVEKFRGLIEKASGKIINQEIWGNKKLAYTIKKHTSGYYVFTEFTATGDLITDLEREYQFDERIIRYLTVKMNKHGIAYAEKRRVKLKSQAAN